MKRPIAYLVSCEDTEDQTIRFFGITPSLKGAETMCKQLEVLEQEKCTAWEARCIYSKQLRDVLWDAGCGFIEPKTLLLDEAEEL